MYKNNRLEVLKRTHPVYYQGAYFFILFRSGCVSVSWWSELELPNVRPSIPSRIRISDQSQLEQKIKEEKILE